jgi:hypothetical protein
MDSGSEEMPALTRSGSRRSQSIGEAFREARRDHPSGTVTQSISEAASMFVKAVSLILILSSAPPFVECIFADNHNDIAMGCHG